ncbi:MAG: AMP-binding protein, partial [Pseudomonadota bacterium]
MTDPSVDTRAHAAAKPDAVAWAMSDTGEAVTFAQLETRANRGAHLLREAGLGVGDHFALLMENRRELLEVCFAADRAGVYYTCISSHLTAPEVAYIAADCGAKLLVTSARFAPSLADLPPDLPVYAVGPPPPGALSWDEAAAAQPETPIADERQGL